MELKVWNYYNANFEADEINKELAVSPWSGHRNFAYDLIANLKPNKIVELGTHYGCSFFSFLQSCKDFKIDCEVIAIDSWQGDEQAGFYGEDVWNTVNKTVNEKFSNQNVKLLRKFFCEAVDDIADETADIIHIDGLHTYEAVKEDFTTWLPKLKKDGIILFHDVHSKLGYGSDKFWDELTKQYGCYYEFVHSWGLGMLFPKGSKYYDRLKELQFKEKILYYEQRAYRELFEMQLIDHKKMIDDRDECIKSMTKMINEKDECIESMTKMINEKDECIKSMTQTIDERDECIKSMTKMINEKDECIESMTQMIDERDAYIKELEKEIGNE